MDRRYGGPRRSHPRPYFRPAPYGGRSRFGPGQEREEEPRWQEDRRREDWRRDDNPRHDEERRLADRRRSEERRRAEDDRLREEERLRAEGRWQEDRRREDWRRDDNRRHDEERWLADRRRSEERRRAEDARRLREEERRQAEGIREHERARRLTRERALEDARPRQEQERDVRDRWQYRPEMQGGASPTATGSSSQAGLQRSCIPIQNTSNALTRNHGLVNYYVPVSANPPLCADNEKGKGPLVEETSSSTAAMSFGTRVGQCSAGGLFQSGGGPVIHENNNICERNVEGERRHAVLNHDQPVLEEVHEEVAQALAPQMIGHVLNPDYPNGDDQGYQDFIKYLLKRNGTGSTKIVGYEHLIDEDDDQNDDDVDLIDDDDQMEDAEEAEVAADYSYSDESGGMVESGEEPGYITGVVMALAVPQGVEEVQSVIQSGSSQPEAMSTQENQDPDVGYNGGQARSGPRV